MARSATIASLKAKINIEPISKIAEKIHILKKIFKIFAK
jgi:hypothetical protein